jgi:hypothetical protein
VSNAADVLVRMDLTDLSKRRSNDEIGSRFLRWSARMTI